MSAAAMESAADPRATIARLVRHLQMVEVRLTVMAWQLPQFGMHVTAEGCAREVAAIRQVLNQVRA